MIINPRRKIPATLFSNKTLAAVSIIIILKYFLFPCESRSQKRKKRNFLLELCLLHSDSANKSSPTLVEVGAHFYPIFLVKSRHCGTILDHLVWQMKKSTICTSFMSCSDQESGKSYALEKV